MNFDWTEEEKQILTKVKAVVGDDARDDLDRLEAGETADVEELTRKYLGLLAGAGYLAPGLGPDGREDALTLLAAQEEVASASASLFLAVEASQRLFGGLVAGWGSEALRGEVAGGLADGSRIGAVALSEPGGEEPFEGWRTTAVAGEDGSYLVSGTKGFVTNAPIADHIAVVAGVGEEVAAFVIDRGQEGASVGPRAETLGLGGLAASAVSLDNVVVAADRVIGPVPADELLSYLESRQDLALAVSSYGVSKRTLSHANDYARSHHRGKKPIYAHQEVRFRLADMFTLCQASQLIAYRAAWFLASGEREAGVLINCAKVFNAESAEKIAGMGMQIMAGQGYLKGNPVERGYREAKYGALAGTTSEVSRMRIAKDILRRHAL